MPPAARLRAVRALWAWSTSSFRARACCCTLLHGCHLVVFVAMLLDLVLKTSVFKTSKPWWWTSLAQSGLHE
jgi:hypothetical protein